MHNSEQDNSELSFIDEVDAGLGTGGYIASRQISTAITIAHHLRKPILVEGPPSLAKPSSPSRSRHGSAAR